MEREIIEGSSRVAEIGYSRSKLTLQVKFQKGGIYNYTPVTQEQFDELMAAESVGKYLGENIIKNENISYKKVG